MFRFRFPFRRVGIAATLCAAFAGTNALAQARAHASDDEAAPALASEPVALLARSLKVGDIVFTRIGAYPFRKVAEATGTWTNHVGIVLDVSGDEPVIGESRFPFSGSTTLARFVARSAGGRVAVMRLPVPLTSAQQIAIVAAAAQREHAFDPQADTGFWRAGYFGGNPWERETVTASSVLHTPGLKTIFDGAAF